MIEALIIGCFGFVAYTYFGYPAFLWMLARRRPPPETDLSFTPAVTVVIAAFNEAGCIGETLSTLLASDYPPEALHVIVVSDASDDGTDAAVAAFPSERVRLLRQAERSGQTRGLLRGAGAARTRIVILADASGRYLPQTIRRLTRHFVDSRLGAVSGYNSVDDTGTAVAKGDGVYARYDRWLRALESRWGSSWVGCQGGLFAIRKDLFRGDFPLDMAADNVTCYQLYERGYLHRFDPKARVIEPPPKDLENEFRRKVRIIVLQLHGLRHFRRLFNPFRHPVFFFQNVSHKVFRWLVPFALLAMWGLSAVSRQRWARAFFAGQSGFYALALAGALYPKNKRAPRSLAIPAYFATVNLAGLFAWAMLLRDYTVWTPPARAAETPIAPAVYHDTSVKVNRY